MKFLLLEPLKDLFKDEVRKLGRELNIKDDFVNRHPFPGPGLGIRILGEINQKNVKILKEADHIFLKNLLKNTVYTKKYGRRFVSYCQLEQLALWEMEERMKKFVF